MSGQFLTSNRERAIVGSVVVSVAFVGFWVGVRQRPAEAEYSSFTEEEKVGTAEPARSNEELSLRPWSSDLPKWSPTIGDMPVPVTRHDQKAYEEALEKRAQRRAFEGAPPSIPHPVAQGSARECLICHGKGATIGNSSAPRISHKVYISCTQCHVPEMGALPQDGEINSFVPMVESTFVGLRETPAPWKFAEGSPPQIPHTTFMREKCNTCHGPQGRPGIQTSHPDRQSCTQCHAPSAEVDQRGLESERMP